MYLKTLFQFGPAVQFVGGPRYTLRLIVPLKLIEYGIDIYSDKIPMTSSIYSSGTVP